MKSTNNIPNPALGLNPSINNINIAQSIVFIAVFKVLLFVNDSVLSYGDELVPVGMVLREAVVPKGSEEKDRFSCLSICSRTCPHVTHHFLCLRHLTNNRIVLSK